MTIFFINNLREKFSPGPGFKPGSPALCTGTITTKPPKLGPVDRLGGLVVISPACRAGNPSSNPGPGKNFSLKLLIYDLTDGYSES